MARDYMALPDFLDTLEDEMDREAQEVMERARDAHARGLRVMDDVRVAVSKKHAVIDRMENFASQMEARNTGNGGPKIKAENPTIKSSDASQTNSAASADSSTTSGEVATEATSPDGAGDGAPDTRANTWSNTHPAQRPQTSEKIPT